MWLIFENSNQMTCTISVWKAVWQPCAGCTCSGDCPGWLISRINYSGGLSGQLIRAAYPEQPSRTRPETSRLHSPFIRLTNRTHQLLFCPVFALRLYADDDELRRLLDADFDCHFSSLFDSLLRDDCLLFSPRTLLQKREQGRWLVS